MTPECPKQADPLFSYTSGRWLWNEDKQLQERFRYFQVPEFQEAGRRAVGASRCLAITKIGEGNFNKAYRLEMDDGQIVVGKIPHPNAGPSFFTTSSEVATMEYTRSVLGLPVPKVLAWSASDDNPVGAEYIIMEEAKGIRLDRVWDDLDLEVRCDILDQIVDIESKLLSVSFQQIGSLYFKDSDVPGCMPAAPTSDSQDIVDQISSRFCLGPIARREFWEQERAQMPQYHGPWNTASEYMTSVAQREMEWIQRYGPSHPDNVTEKFVFRSSDQKSPEAHIAALERVIAAIPHIVPRDPTLACPRFWHPDFHNGNIFVDGQNRISSIIDWQGSWTTPVFLGANPPLVLDYYNVELIKAYPPNYQTLSEAKKTAIKSQALQSILIYSYRNATTQRNPMMHQMMNHPNQKILRRLVELAGGTWECCLMPLKNCLQSIESDWEDFDTDEPCPYEFSYEELQRLYDEGKAFKLCLQYFHMIKDIVNADGYTSDNTYGEAMRKVAKMRQTQLEWQSDSGYDSDSEPQHDSDTESEPDSGSGSISDSGCNSASGFISDPGCSPDSGYNSPAGSNSDSDSNSDTSSNSDSSSKSSSSSNSDYSSESDLDSTKLTVQTDSNR